MENEKWTQKEESPLYIVIDNHSSSVNFDKKKYWFVSKNLIKKTNYINFQNWDQIETYKNWKISLIFLDKKRN